MNQLRLVFLVAFLMPFFAFAQTNVGLKGELVNEKNAELDNIFNEYKIFKINTLSLKNYLKNNFGKAEATFILGDDYTWTAFLEPSNIMKAKTADVWDGEKIVQYIRDFDPTFKGVTNQGDDVRLTIDEDYLSGSFKSKNKEIMIQPLTDYLPSADKTYIIVYDVKKVKPQSLGKCGVHEVETKKKHLHDNFLKSKNASKTPLACYDVELASCTDFSFYTKYGSTIAGAQNRVLAIMNLVETNYTGSFNHTLKFVVVRWFNSTSATEPWSAQQDASLLIDEFRIWANANITGPPTFEIGQFWTNRSLTTPNPGNGNPVGIAYVGAVCSTFKYQVLQDFSANNNFMRVMVAHETGHNFNCGHDAIGATTIMAPSVQNTTTWSTASINSVNAYLPGVISGTCLTACATGSSPTASFTAAPNPICQGSAITFTNTSTGAPTSHAWTFAGGTPATSTATSPSVTYTASGTYGVTLTSTNANGSNTTTQNITVNPPPVPNFTNTITGLAVGFTNSSTNATTYSWAFGNGNTSTQANPSITYASAGTYNVTLTATGPCGTQNIVKQIIVTSNPLTVAYSTATTTGCAPLSVQFLNGSSGATSYSWNMPGATPSTSGDVNPIVTYNTAGTYSVTLTASNASTTTSIVKTAYITVIGSPIPNYSVSVAGNTATFTNSSTGATSYTWAFGGGNTSTQTNPVYTFPSPGTYTVTLTATNACNSVPIVQTLDIAQPPVAAFMSSVSSGCAPLSVQYSDQSTGATSYEWTFPGGNPAASIAKNPNVTYSAAGSYTATLKVTNSSGTNTLTSTTPVVVSVGAVANFTSTVSGTTAIFTNTSTDALTYQWKFGDGGINTDPNPTHTYSTPGSYAVTLTSTNNCATNSIVKTITITAPAVLPKAIFTVATANGCTPFSTTFNNTSTDAQTYAWTFQGGTPATSTDKTPSVVYNTAGTYSVTLVVGNSVGKDTLKLNNCITVGSKPATTFTNTINNAKVTFTNGSTNATTYLWEFGDGKKATKKDTTYTYANDGTYKVTLTSTNTCGSTTYTKDIIIVTPPKASFALANGNGCIPFSAAFNNTSSTNAATYEWTFAGGTPSTSTTKNPTVVYNQKGTFDVILIVSNAVYKDTLKLKNLVIVDEKPSTAFTNTVNKAVVNFTNTSTNAATYLWEFGDGKTATKKDTNYTFLNDGTYKVTLTSTNPCGSTTYTKDVIIVTPPKASFAAAQSSGCLPFVVTFDNTSSNNTATYEWTFAGGNPSTSTDKNPNVTYATAGSFDVKLIVSNSVYKDTLVKKAFVSTVAKAKADFSSTKNGLTVNFTNASLGAAAYTWTFGDGGTSALQNPAHTYTTDGTYNVKLIVTSNCGNDTIQKSVTVQLPPKAIFKATTQTGCAPMSIDYSNQSSGANLTYDWSFAGGTPATSTDKNPTVVYSQKGSFDVRLITSNAAGKDTILSKNFIVVNTVPTAGFTKKVNAGAVDFTNTSTNATKYSWDFGDSGNSTDKDPSHTYIKSGKYIIALSATNQCGTTITKDSVLIEFTGVDNVQIFKTLRLFPNPNQGNFNLEVKGASAEKIKIVLQNSLGQILEQNEYNFSAGELQTTFDVERFPSGTYILQFIKENKSEFLKFEKM
jgi:PKD repeat protein